MEIMIPGWIITALIRVGLIWVVLKAIDMLVTACIPEWQVKRAAPVSQAIWFGRAAIWFLVALGYCLAYRS